MEAVGAVGNGWLLAMHERVEPERIAGVEGGAEWIRGREGVRGLGRRLDRIDCIDRIDLVDVMDVMDGMESGVGGTRRVGLRCSAAGPSGKQAADTGEGSEK